MPKLNGDWFHSRTSCHLSELAAIQLLVSSSSKTEYVAKKWTANRHNPNNRWLYSFSQTAKLGADSIEPSTMQTKIRNWIRLGFLEDSIYLPLQWTQLGLLWNNAVTNGNGSDANLLYRLIISNAIATISFSCRNTRGVDSVPIEDGLAVKHLLIKSNCNSGLITKKQLEQLIDGQTSRVGKNYSYWVTDLVNSGLFDKVDEGGLKKGSLFRFLTSAIENYKPANDIEAMDVIRLPLAIKAPFREELIRELYEYGSDDLKSAIDTISGLDISLEVTQTESVRVRNLQLERTSNWSKSVKDMYKYKCAIPGCDAEGVLFVESAHIMPFRSEDVTNSNFHRNDLNNGIALCLSCHRLFDAGLFTFDKNGGIILSKFIYSSELIRNSEQINVIRLLDSRAHKVQIPEPLKFSEEYANYHRANIFLGE